MNGANHRMDGASTCPFHIFRHGRERVTPDNAQLLFRGDTVIGSGVWIDGLATLMPGVRVGDGAIIAANAAVTKDVEPYAVYGGNPARLLRMRFDGDIVAFLLKLRRWDRDAGAISDRLESLTSGEGLERLMREHGKG